MLPKGAQPSFVINICVNLRIVAESDLWERVSNFFPRYFTPPPPLTARLKYEKSPAEGGGKSVGIAKN